ncbi:MAG TPA: hemolysin family protein [Gemmatimonadaceae bacterium]|nr:hemolysin family protein [Gemmatimonadaceae bacterium]
MQAAEHLSFSAYAWRLGLVVLLVVANAFFVAAEFALVSARRSKIDQMASEGDRLAKAAQSAMKNLNRYISATQLGITLTSLGLGWIGEPALAGLMDRALAVFGIRPPAAAVHTVAGATTAFIVITFLHIVLGELTPKAIALVKAEGVSRYLVIPLMVFAKVMSPAINLLYGAANVLLRRLGISQQSDAHHVHSPEELRLLVMQARAHGTLDETDSAMLAGVFDFHEKKAYDVMRPRTEVAALDIDSTEEEVWAVVRRERYSRYPVYRETLDDVAGVFLAKDLWLHDGHQPFALKDFVRPALYVPSSKPAERVMDDLRKTRAQMAVVLDEYGGTAGILTMEDLVEEVVGDIADEYDFASRTAVIMDGVLELAGSMSLVDVRSDYGLRIPEGDWTTLGGYAFGRLGRLPKIGDRVAFPGGELEIIALEGRRVAGLRVHRDNADKVAATAPAGAVAH